MKKTLIAICAFFAFSFATQAQSTYRTALGLGIDFGEGATLVGPSIKHFFNGPHAGMGEFTFGNHITSFTALYQYHGDISNANGLMWFAGIGPSIMFADSYSEFMLRPNAGLDYRITNTPLTFSFDWRPIISFEEYSDTFTPGRFGLGIRFALN